MSLWSRGVSQAVLVGGLLAWLTGVAAAEQDCGNALVCAQVAPSVFDDVIGQVDEFRVF